MKKSRGKLTSEPALYIQGRGEWVRFRRREREKKKEKDDYVRLHTPW